MAGNVKEEHYKIIYDTGGVIKPKGDEQETKRNNALRQPTPASMYQEGGQLEEDNLKMPAEERLQGVSLYKKGGEVEELEKKITDLKEQKRIAGLSEEKKEEHQAELDKHKDVKTYRTSKDYEKKGVEKKVEVDKDVLWSDLSFKEKRELKKKHPDLHINWDKSIVIPKDETVEGSRDKRLTKKGWDYKKGSDVDISVKESTVFKDVKDDYDKIISKLVSEKDIDLDESYVQYQDRYGRAPTVDETIKETDPDEYKKQVDARQKYFDEHPLVEKIDQEESTYRQRNFPLGIESHRKVFSKRNEDGELEYYQDWDFESMPKKILQKIAAFFGNYDFLEDEPRKISKKKFERISKKMGERHSRHVKKTDIEGAPHNRTGKTRTKMVRDWDLGGKKEVVEYQMIDEDGRVYWTRDLYRPRSSASADSADKDNLWKRKKKEQDIEEIKKHTSTKHRMGGQIGFSYKNQRYQKPKGDNYASSDRASQGESFSNDIAGMGE